MDKETTHPVFLRNRRVTAAIRPVLNCRLSVVNGTELRTQKARDCALNPFQVARIPGAAT